jgi:hypothetical protein
VPKINIYRRIYGKNKFLKWRLHLCSNQQIKKILKVDFPRGKAKEYPPTAGRLRQLYFIPKLKIEFSIFHPSINLQMPVGISPEIQGRIYGTPRYA